ncbi:MULTISPECIES: MFS transporter [Empedobacter]|uniref:MFS transporter n=1 Tax=Empedobacter falsenii TaxID=343874 RepID=A0A3R8SN28_9FLAO|nr:MULTISPECIES: MFS transporter [Empedobacter]HAR71835.1 MFS transporter [Flavobacteriaceae bacterium]MBW1618302.1 MFS transporter [Empedobacter falsenii]MDH2207969.1 MFS transporter [Empedobacter sp. GD03644]MDM1296984.1 MFS transporter [Empedobacter falsenii]MDM1316777.1 MFS transporter [Empedobacter falsenii]
MVKKSLLALAMGGLAIGMTEFSMMGVLEDFAKDLNISIPTAGNFISMYAMGVMVGAPTLIMATSKYSPKKVLIFFMLLFTIFNSLFVIAPSYNTLLIARFMSGLPHGAFFGVGSVVAAQLATKGKEAQAISIMFAGLTFANLVGVPLGTKLGQVFSWRLTFGIIASLGLITMLAISLWVPNLKNTNKGSLVEQLSFFKKWEAWVLIVMISIGTSGLFAWISYISPLMTNVADLPKTKVPIIMTLIGLGMFVGNFIGGKLADTMSPNKAAIISFASMAVCLVIVYFTSHIQIMAYIMSFITGLIAFTIGSPIQMMLINNGKGSETLAAAAGQASFNIGNALGAFLGGIPIAMGLGFNSQLWVGFIMASVGSIIAAIFLQLKSKRV